VGTLFANGPKAAAYAPATVIVHPVLGDGKTGSVVIQFLWLEIMGTSAQLKIYEGVGTSGTPLVIDVSNAAQYVNDVKSLQFDGPVTITFESGGITGDVGGKNNFRVELRYLTGDQVFTPAFGRLSAAWTDFIQPNSYTIVDDLLVVEFFQYELVEYGNAVPMVVGYFDDMRQYVSSEIAICIQYNRDVPSVGEFYPGSMVYTIVNDDNFDMNDNGVFEPVEDKLAAARMIYLLNKLDNPTRMEALYIQLAIWAVSMGWSGGFEPISDALVWEANEMVPELPVPYEPTFSITAPTGSVSTAGTQDFVVNFDIAGSHAWKVKLSTSDFVSITGVTGDVASFNPSTGELVFSQVPAQVTVSTVSSVSQTGTLYAIYDEADFWKVNNISVYESCDPAFQSFIGLTQKDIEKPFREASAVWTPVLPVTLARFEVQGAEEHVQISWSTTNEKDNRGFEVQKSIDGLNWQALGFVEAQSGNVSGGREMAYHFADHNPKAGYNYYRLKQVDLDGTYTFTPVRRIYFEGINAHMTVSPNPVLSGRAKIRIDGDAHPLVSIYNAMGVEVSRTRALNGELNLQNLSSGLYLVKATDGEGNIYRKTIVVK